MSPSRQVRIDEHSSSRRRVTGHGAWSDEDRGSGASQKAPMRRAPDALIPGVTLEPTQLREPRIRERLPNLTAT
jgi:hypothetical protein